MELLATLRESGGLNALARQMGLPPATILSLSNALLPGLVERFWQYDGGMPALLQFIEEAGGAGMALEIMSENKVDIQPGLQLLARIGNPAPMSGVVPGGVTPAPDMEVRLTSLMAMLLRPARLFLRQNCIEA